MLCLYLMGLNLSNAQIAQELDLDKDDVHQMTAQLCAGIVERKPEPVLSGVVECDEIYLVAGHKGHRRWKGERGRGTRAKEKPPSIGMLERGGQVVIRMLPEVKQQTIKPLLTQTIAPGSTLMTDEYDIYSQLIQWGYQHQTVCHSKGEFARDDDGFCEVHVNTIEGFWSLLRSWLRPHRGISQELLLRYLGFFEYIHNVRTRGEALWGSLLALLLT
jgi:transposase-like protein